MTDPVRAQIVGLDSEPVRDDQDCYMLLHRHYNRLFSNRFFREAKEIVFIGENNLGNEASHLETMLKDLDRVEVYWESNRRAGVCKTERITRQYQFLMANALACNGLRFDQDLFTVSREQTADSILDLLAEQCYRLHWERRKTSDASGTEDPRVKLTAKVAGKSDDLLISLFMIFFWGRLIIAKRSK